ncbi:hypothetical protein PVAND_013047 [Polypedilum vanderplanki]|uniref:Uncharacterized protein n=1 Tax=Polypedilum vanderplanki TaxID=319348 RepID=A0A9J6CPI7_POLVA|nr:hypothetical protein PVAND_013047 [Polypedilum vanderplanki]
MKNLTFLISFAVLLKFSCPPAIGVKNKIFIMKFDEKAELLMSVQTRNQYQNMQIPYYSQIPGVLQPFIPINTGAFPFNLFMPTTTAAPFPYPFNLLTPPLTTTTLGFPWNLIEKKK